MVKVLGYYLNVLKTGIYTPISIVLKILLIILIAYLVAKIGCFIIAKVFEKQKRFKYSLDNKKADTLATLVSSVFRYGVYIIAIVTILSDVFNLKSVIAAAGVGGVAIGFGAQSLIKDVISGFFIVMENQFVVGDTITLDTMYGTVEEMELRVTKIRHANGDLFIIPNGEIKKVTNHTRGSKAATVDIPIAYSTDIKKAFIVAEEVCAIVAADIETVVVEKPQVLGITELGKDNINLRITAKTLANEQFEVERKIRKLITERFIHNNITFSDKYKPFI